MPRKTRTTAMDAEAPKAFSIGTAFGFAWGTASNNVGLLVAFLAIRLALDLTGGAVEGVAKHLDSPAWELAALLFKLFFYLPLSIWLTTGFLVLSLRLARGRESKFEDCFPSLKAVGNYLGGTLVLMLLFVFGFLLLIVPGFYFLLKYQFAPYLMVDRELSLRDAFDMSARMTEGHKWHLFGLVWACFGVLIVGLLACCIGVLWAWVLAQIAYVQVYLTLLEQADPEGSLKEAV